MIGYEIACAAFCCFCVVADVIVARIIKKEINNYLNASSRLLSSMQDAVDNCQEVIAIAKRFTNHE